MNSLSEMMIASRHGDFPVKKGDKIAGTRIIPLVIEKEKMERAKEAAEGGPIFPDHALPQEKNGHRHHRKRGLLRQNKDTFGPVVKEKIAEYPTEFLGQTLVDDQKEHIQEAILHYIDEGAELVLCTGGMSVDPDDCTPGAIAGTGAKVITYGAPVLPGAMLLLAYYEKDGKKIPIVGLPGCVMYAKRRSSIWCFRG